MPRSNSTNAARASGGFTLIELMVYLMLFASMSGVIVGSDIFARRVNHTEGSLLRALGDVDRLFRMIADDCDRAGEIDSPLVTAGDVHLGGATYTIDASKKSVSRDGKLVVGEALAVRFELDAAHPRLLRVSVRVVRGDGKLDVVDRTFERSFSLNAAGSEDVHRGAR